jgi:halogenation protein CepH
MSEQFDVVVVGGGPGGSTLSTLVAKEGHRVLLLDKEAFPRYQIGESLLPATVHGICRLLGVEDKIASAGFPVKRGGTFRWGANPEPWQFSFAVSPRIAGPTAHAYQVERMRFDKILLDNARDHGVDVRERHAVTGVIEDGDQVVGVRYRDADGRDAEVRARFVIDASGNTSRIARHVGGARSYSEFFRNLAVFGYFEGGGRMPKPNDGNILSVAFEHGWFWYIPLSDTLTSVGAVVDPEMTARVQADPEQALAGLIQDCPLIRDNLANATRVTEGTYGQVRVRKDWSYCSTTFWRPGMALIGDAACFVDPVFSSGVHLATYSALLAARSVNSVLAGTVAEKPAFAEFESRYRREYGLFYEFLLSFYSLNLDEQSYFWQAKKVTGCSDSELQSFVNLVGGVSSGEPTLIAERFATSAGQLADAVDDAGSSAEHLRNPLFGASIVNDVMREGVNVQVQAISGKASSRTTANDGGLVASDDGLRWLAPVGQ